MKFHERYGPWALITGAASGIGAEFARLLAERGLDLLLLDVDESALLAHVESLSRANAVEIVPLVADLSHEDFLSAVEPALEGRDLGLLICNAAVGSVGRFEEGDLADHTRAIDVNCRATLQLTHRLVPGLVERGHGGVILLASNAAFQGTPFVANYAATKAYNLVLGESLWYELAPRGVDVLAFAPGGTNTPSLRRGNPELREGEAPAGIMLPAPTAEAALGALGRAPSARPNLRGRIETFILTRLLSRRRAIKRVGRATSTMVSSSQ
ncbi:MAG: SDR family NAD(P)-dependent oxidoreductase [Myxococcota bacterium]